MRVVHHEHYLHRSLCAADGVACFMPNISGVLSLQAVFILGVRLCDSLRGQGLLRVKFGVWHRGVKA